jgi:hypothetical protein
LLKILRISLSVIIVTFAIYMLVTKNFEYISYNMFLLSVLMLVIGADEFKKGYGYLTIAAALFGFFVTFQEFFLG